MSREAVEAVQDHSAVEDAVGRNIFQAIARFVPPDGSGGWASYRTIADVARCDKDTVMRWVGILEEMGEIGTRKTGRGRGTRIYYTIHLPFDEPRHGGAGVGDNIKRLSPSGGDNNGGDIIEVLSQRIEVLSQQVELLSQQLEVLSPLLSQNVPTKMGTETRNHRETKGNRYKHARDPLAEEPSAFEPAPRTKDQSDREEMIAAIAQVVKTAYVPGFGDEPFIDTANALLQAGVGPDEVRGFGQWWEENGYYDGQPALKSMIGEWGNYSAGISPRASPNGRQAEPAGFAALRNVLGEFSDG